MTNRILQGSNNTIVSSESTGEVGKSPTFKPFEADTVEVKPESETGCFSELKLKICAFFRWLLCCICCRTSEQKIEKEILTSPTTEVETETSVPSKNSQTLPAEPLAAVTAVESEPQVELPALKEVLPSEKEAFGRAENYLLKRDEDPDLARFKELDKTAQLCILFILACDENFEIIDQYYRAYGNNKSIATAAPLNFYHIQSGDLDIVALPLQVEAYFEEDLQLFEELATYRAVKDSRSLLKELSNRAIRSFGTAERFFRSVQGRPTEESDVHNFDAMSDAVKLLIVAFYLTPERLKEGRILIFYPRIQTIFNDPTNFPDIRNPKILQVRLLSAAKELLFPA